MLSKLDFRFTEVAGVITSLIASLSLVGWLFNIPLLTSAVPEYVTMKFNTALCFLLSGVALVYLSKTRKNDKIANISSVLVVLTGLLTLGEHLLRWNLGLDQLFWLDKITTTSHPGRMSLATSVNFILIGSGLVLLSLRKFERTIQIIAVTVAFLSLLSITVNDYENEYANILPFFTTMALHTALLFILLSLGLAYAPKSKSLKFNLAWNLGWTVLAITSIVLITFYILSKISRDLRNTGPLMAQVYEAKFVSERLGFLIKAIQTSTTFYLKTGDSREIKSIGQLFLASDSCVARLRILGADIPFLQGKADSLRTSMDEAAAYIRVLPQIITKGPPTTESSVEFEIGGRLTNKALEDTERIQYTVNHFMIENLEANHTNLFKSSRAIKFLQILIILVLTGASIMILHTFRARIRAEAELNRSREWFSTTLSSIGDAVIATDNRGNVTFMNPVAQELTGWNQDEANGAPIGTVLDVINEATRNKVENPVKKVLDQGKVIGLANHTLLRKRDGNEVPIDDSAAPIVDSQGKVVGVVLVFRDVTEKQQNHKAILQLNKELETKVAQLQESEEKFQKTFQASAAGISITHLSDGIYLDVNDTFVEMTGFSKEELIGHSSIELGMISNVNKRNEVWQQIKETGSAKNFELTVQHKSGAVFEVLSSVETILLSEKKYAINTIYDITERKRDTDRIHHLNEELKASIDQLEESKRQVEKADRMKSNFLSNMSHELRTPLNGIIGFSELLIDKKVGPLNPHQEEYLGDILNSGNHLLRLINDILDLSKIESGKLELSIETFLAKDAIEEVRSVVNSIANKKQIQLTTTIASNIKEVSIDKHKFKQILYNLLSNAIKFTPEGGKVCVDVKKEDEWFSIQVRDTGIGMSQEGMDKLFTPFVQLDSGLSRKQEGTGLGLVLTKRFVELHRGSIEIESEVSIGSVFTVKLPICILQDQDENV